MDETAHLDAVIAMLNNRIELLEVALVTIRDMPIKEQDNMVACNMRKVARDIL